MKNPFRAPLHVRLIHFVVEWAVWGFFMVLVLALIGGGLALAWAIFSAMVRAAS